MYKTELTEEILKSPMAQTFIQRISPLYGEAYTVLWLIQAIGTVLDSMEEWTGSLEKQVVPQTATWSLPYWEEQYGITSDPSWTYERRRQSIINKRMNRAPINPTRMANIAYVAAGVPARIEENTGKNKFTVYISANKELVNEELVRKEIDNIKPAHLIYDIKYEQYIEENHYVGGIIQVSKEIKLVQY